MVPFWVWILLWIFLFANFAYGVYYVVRLGLDALAKVGSTADEVGQIMGRMSSQERDAALDDSVPFFTRPLTDAADRYARTREAVEKKHIARSLRHEKAFNRWTSYSQKDLEQMGEQLEQAAQISDERARLNTNLD